MFGVFSNAGFPKQETGRPALSVDSLVGTNPPAFSIESPTKGTVCLGGESDRPRIQ